MQVKQGEIYGLIGPNGAGKTTIFNLLTGVYEPTSGDINIVGKRINGLRPYQISRLGVSRTFQNIRLFPSMTRSGKCRHGLSSPRQSKSDRRGFSPAALFQGRSASIANSRWNCWKFSTLPNTRTKAERRLPYGNQRRLEIVRALATRPQLLLLDEPAAGMNPSEQEDLTAFD